MSDHPSSGRTLRGLIVDWGGVLTEGVPGAMEAWAASEGIDIERYRALMRDWLGPGYSAEAQLNPVHAIERGEITVPDFERRFAAALSHDGVRVRAEGLIDRLFARFEHVPSMNALVWRARRAGLRTALLSNSWGNTYPRDGWDDMFDAVVISGEVGMRKPEPRIYRYACQQIGLRPRECVFVDDIGVNVRAARDVGMVAVHFQSYEQTAQELEAIFGLSLAS